MKQPLINFTILCYNQEKYIREAINGAFSQTYSPLDIIISDDCSKDSTFDIVQQMVGAYKGPHAVRINRNPTNLGLAGNSNKVSAMCRGELIVGAAGDDISLPERVETVVRAWNDSGRKATSLWSNAIDIDAGGRPVRESIGRGLVREQIKWIHEQGTIAGFLRRRTPHANGSSNAISRSLISIFGPLPNTVTYEDTAYSFRTLLVGGLFTFIDAPLVKYRRHDQNITFALHQVRPKTVAAFKDFQEKQLCELDRFIEVYKCFATDAECAFRQGLISSQDYPNVKSRILREGRRMELRKQLLIRGLFRRWAILGKLYSSSFRPREMLTQVPHLLPRSLHCAAVTARNRIVYRKQARSTA